MKRFWRIMLLAAAAVALLCVTAYAENANVLVKTTSSKLSNIIYYSAYSEANNTSTVSETYTDTVAFGMTYTDSASSEGTMAILLMSTASTPTEVTAENIQYINLVTFDANHQLKPVLYPTAVGMSYIYISYTGTGGLTKIAEVKTDKLYGDANHDGNVNLLDLARLARYLVHADGVTIDSASTDVNLDGSVNLFDQVRIAKYLVHIDGVVLGQK